MELERVSGWHDILINLIEQGQPLATACANARVPMTRVFNEESINSKFKQRMDRAKKVGRGEEDRSGAVGETARVGADNPRGRIVAGCAAPRR